MAGNEINTWGTPRLAELHRVGWANNELPSVLLTFGGGGGVGGGGWGYLSPLFFPPFNNNSIAARNSLRCGEE